MTSVVRLRIRHPGAYFRKVSDWNVARRSWPERRGSFQAVGACRERIPLGNSRRCRGLRRMFSARSCSASPMMMPSGPRRKQSRYMSYCGISPTSSAPWLRRAGNDVFDVVDSEHDAAYAQRVRRCAFRLGSDRRRRVELRQLKLAVAVRGPHHGDVGTHVVRPDDAVHPTPLDCCLAFQLHTEFDEERFGNLADRSSTTMRRMVHPLNR